MRRVHTLVLASALALACLAARGDGHGALVEDLFRESGLEMQLVAVPAQIVEGFAQGRTGDGVPDLTPESLALLEVEIRKAFDPETLGRQIRSDIASGLGAADIARVLEWLRSPLGRRLTTMEEDASTVEAYAAISAYGRSLHSVAPDDRRLVKIDTLLRSMNALDAAVSLALSTQMGVVTAIVAATPGSTAQDLSAAILQIEGAREQVTQYMRSEVLVASLYTYRDASDAELDRYIAFAETESGRRYHEVTFRSFGRAMVLASQRLGKRVIQALRGSAA